MENGLNGTFVLKTAAGANIIGHTAQFDHGINIHWMKDLLRCKAIKPGVLANKGVINTSAYPVTIYNTGTTDLHINDKLWVLPPLTDKAMQTTMFEGNVFPPEVYEKTFIQAELSQFIDDMILLHELSTAVPLKKVNTESVAEKNFSTALGVTALGDQLSSNFFWKRLVAAYYNHNRYSTPEEVKLGIFRFISKNWIMHLIESPKGTSSRYNNLFKSWSAVGANFTLHPSQEFDTMEGASKSEEYLKNIFFMRSFLTAIKHAANTWVEFKMPTVGTITGAKETHIRPNHDFSLTLTM